MNGVERLVAAVVAPRQEGPPAAVFRYGTVVSVGGGAATVTVDGVAVAGVPLYCAGVVAEDQVLLLAQGGDLIVLAVRQ